VDIKEGRIKVITEGKLKSALHLITLMAELSRLTSRRECTLP
jgi:hypothetical protein